VTLRRTILATRRWISIGEKRSNATHQSTTDPEARLFKKGKGREAKLAYMGHVLMENRHGLVIDAELTSVTGTAEREMALQMLARTAGSGEVTVGADKGYDTRDFVAGLGILRSPHTWRRTPLDAKAQSMAERRVIQDTRSARESVSGWKRSSAG
jgi:hypothetical protein